ncbi:MAG: hypothetical protein PHW87_10475 [Methanothrix sp.]|nr:hypothetical protein [Methanothrix sp.]
MDIELLPTVSLLPETFNVLIAPVELLTGALNSHLELQRYKILFISGNYSRILSRLNRNITELDVRRAFTVFQLMTILQENHHSFLIVEHDPLLNEDAKDMVEYLAQALRQTGGDHPALRAGAGPPPAEDRGAGRPGVLHLQRAGSGQMQEDRGEDAGSAEDAGGILMRWLWRQQARPVEPKRAVSLKAQELETAKEILAEVFHARPGEVEEMIRTRRKATLARFAK